MVISFKGTSTLFGGGDTVSEDKYMVHIARVMNAELL